MKKNYFFLLLLTLSLSFVACQHRDDTGEDVSSAVDTVQEALPAIDTVADVDTMPVAESQKPQKVEKPAVVSRKPRPRKPEPQTVYVESYDAKGLVWGHVVLEGDSGTGTIHDSGENTYAVSCTRHGNELFAVDQNGRRYVFSLKY